MNDALPIVEVRACHRACHNCPRALLLSIPGSGGSAFASTDDVVDSAARAHGWISWAGFWYCTRCKASTPWHEIAQGPDPMQVVGFSERELEQMRDVARMRDATWNRGRR